MACGSCGAKRATQAAKFEVTTGDGRTKVVSTEIEAKAAVARKGGSYKPVR